MPPRKRRLTPVERADRSIKRMSAGTAAGNIESASPARRVPDARIAERRGPGCPCPVNVRTCSPGESYASTVIAMSPLAYWPLNDLNMHPDDDDFDPGVTGQVTVDLSGNGNDGTYQRGILEQPSVFGCDTSYEIFSSNGRFFLPDANLGTEWDFVDFTVAMFIRTSDTSSQSHRLLNRDRSGNDQLWTTGLQQANQAPFFYTRPENATIQGPASLADGQSHFVVFRRDVTGAGKRSIWVDSTKVVEDNTVAGAMEATTNALVFGCYLITGFDQYNGLSQHVAVWDRTVTDAEVDELWTARDQCGEGPCALEPTDDVLLVGTAGNVALPPVVSAQRHIYYVKNISDGTVILDPDGVETIDNASSLTLAPLDSVAIVTDGEEWWIL
jgi:concanavalin A-like lectin/glucanase superfamily protein